MAPVAGNWMIYGANGYTGRLCTAEAVRRGAKPILAGRNAEAIEKLAGEYACRSRAFPLDDVSAVEAALSDVDALLLCAGPFSQTSAAALRACLAAKTHYLDVTGEIPVFEDCFRHHDEAYDRGITVLPGVGFDVVPSDCLAASAAARLPSAISLELAFSTGAGISPGTAKSMIDRMRTASGMVRRNGELVEEPVAASHRRVPFRDRPRAAVSIPWGDIATAYRSTEIPNITCYMAAPGWLAAAMRASRYSSPLLRSDRVQSGLCRAIDRFIAGPTPSEREQAQSQLWVRAEAPNGDALEGTLVTPEGYTLTAMTAVDATLRVLDSDLRPGTTTPSRAFGADYILGFDRCDMQFST